MGYEVMQVATVEPTNEDKIHAFEFELSMDNIGYSDWVLIPESVSTVAVFVETINNTSYYVEHTLNIREKVKNDTAIGEIWDLKTKKINASNWCIPVTAIRLIQASAGNIKMTMRAQ